MIINEEIKYVKNYKLEVTEEELAVIHTLVSTVGGDPLLTWRGVASDIYNCTKEYFGSFGSNCRSGTGVVAKGNVKSLIDTCKNDIF